MKTRRKNYFILTLILIFLVFLVVLIIINNYSNKNTYQPEKFEKPKIVSGIEITHGDTSRKQVIFTFDGGSGVQSANKILEVLNKHKVIGAFFVTGKMIEKNPDLIREMVADGHEIFNHTYDHPHLTELTDQSIAEELNKTEELLTTTADTSSKPYFRAPYGDRNARVLEQARVAGYRSVYWTVDALDWKESSGETSQQVKNRIFSNLAPGNIYLMHLGDNITGNILDEVFTKIENQGYKIVSLTQGL